MVIIAGGSARRIRTQSHPLVRTPHGERFPVSAAEPSQYETSGFACSPRGEFAFIDPLTTSSTRPGPPSSSVRVHFAPLLE